MNFRYETGRLILTVGEPSLAPLVLDFLSRNREDFSHWDRSVPEEYYTLDYQTMALEAEQKLMLRTTGVRFYMFLKNDPDRIIGNISFAYLTEEAGHRASIGYKVDKDFRRNGYAYEAASFLIRLISDEFHLRRLEADILPENKASVALAQKLGFEYEGIARNAHEVAGTDRDHQRYSLIFR